MLERNCFSQSSGIVLVVNIDLTCSALRELIKTTCTNPYLLNGVTFYNEVCTITKALHHCA